MQIKKLAGSHHSPLDRLSRPTMGFINTRSLFVRVITLAATMTLFLALYTYSSYSFKLPSRFFGKGKGRCSPDAWNSGQWTPKPGAEKFAAITQPSDILMYGGLKGCAANREFDWHLAADRKEHWLRFPKALSWVWTPSPECDVRPLNAEGMVRDLVEQGGWLLIGGA